MTWASALYCGTVVHRRLKPTQHRLSYSVFSVLLDIDELPKLHPALRLFSHNRFNLYSFFDKDHGTAMGDLRAYVEGQLAAAGIDIAGGAIRLLCYPRVLGYVFNPLSTYFCHRPDGSLAAILYEVNNTFGDRHSYLIPARDGNPLVLQECAKALHVSPFLGMDMTYRFRILPPGDTLAIGVEVRDAEGPVLGASFSGRRVELSDGALARMVWQYPLMTVKVIVGIHWEALKLWRKGVRFHRRPTPPAEPVSVIRRPSLAETRESVDA